MATITYNNNNNWTAPVTDWVLVEAYGSGGGGAGCGLTTTAGGGGGGGAYAKGTFFVIKGTVYRVLAPPGGAGGSGNANGVVGGLSEFAVNTSGNLSVLVRAAGGGAGNRTNAAGVAGTAAACFGASCWKGGNGAAGVNASGNGGGAGAGGNNAGNGANAALTVGGTGAGGGGNGGNGGTTNTNGTDGTVPGGGGGGAGNNTSGSPKVGGNGQVGHVMITYNEAITVTGKVTNSGANVAGAKVLIIASNNNDAANSACVDVATTNATGDWSATVPDNKTLHCVAQWNDSGTYYNAPGIPYVVT